MARRTRKRTLAAHENPQQVLPFDRVATTASPPVELNPRTMDSHRTTGERVPQRPAPRAPMPAADAKPAATEVGAFGLRSVAAGVRTDAHRVSGRWTEHGESAVPTR